MKNILDKTNYNFIDKLPNSASAIRAFLNEHVYKLESSSKTNHYEQIIHDTKKIISEVDLKVSSTKSKLERELLDRINTQLNENLVAIKYYEKRLTIKDNEYFNFENHSKSIVKIKHKVVAEPFSETKALATNYTSTSIIRIMNRGNKPILAIFYKDAKIVSELICQPYKILEVKHEEIEQTFNEIKLRNTGSNFILCLLEEQIEV